MPGLFLVLMLFCLSSCAPFQDQQWTSNATRSGLLYEQRDVSRQAQDLGPVSTTQDLSQDKRQQEQIRRLLEQEQDRIRTFNQKLQAMTGPHQLEAEGTEALQPAQGTKQESDTQQAYDFNLVNTDIIDVIRLFSKILEEDYLLHPGVQGQVTLHIQDQFNRQEIFELFRGLLRLNSLILIRNQNNILEIMPLEQAPREIASEGLVLYGQTSRDVPRRGQSIQAFRLDFVMVEEMVNVIKPFLSPKGFVYGHEQQGILLISDFPHNLAKVDKLIELFDVSVFADIYFQIDTVQQVAVSDLVEELRSMAQSFGLPESGQQAVSFLGLERLNLLLTLSRDPEVLRFTRAWIDELDRSTPQLEQTKAGVNVYVYYVQNSNAEDLVSSVQAVFTQKESQETKDEEAASEGLLGTQISQSVNGTVIPEPRKQAGESSVSRADLSQQVDFVVDKTTNAILIRCAASDYDKILAVIKKLDLYPKQALIEVMIAEVQLGTTNKLGIEWSLTELNQKNWDTEVKQDSGLGLIGTGGAIGSGFSYLVQKVDNFQLILQALADQNQARILSSPHILASDNKEANINIGQEVPIVTSELRTTEGTSTATQVDKTIQYRDTGIILSVTPHINENGLVRMEISQEISDIATTTVEGVESPVFSQRQASTSVAVRNGQTIVIGGLIRQKNTQAHSSVPGLGQIPVLKHLFEFKGNEWENTELLIFITPHVILNEEDSQFFTQRFLSRLDEIKAQMR